MPLDWIPTELERLRDAGLLRERRRVTPLEEGWCEVEGRRLRNFATNDYLGLAGDPRVQAAAACALDEAGAGARASALVAGRTEWHARLERRLAEFEGAEAALLYPTGYAANVGVITALVGTGDVVLCDRLNHASLIDGCRLSGAKLRVYPHADVAAVEQELAKSTDARRRLIVTDGVFSMDGDAAPLRELYDLAERHHALLLVDEAHGTGVLGEQGRGLTEQLGVEGRGVVRVGTLSKALGSQGGFVVGSAELVNWLFNTSRTQMFSTALAPAACAAACTALDLIAQEPQRRQLLSHEAARLRAQLASAGLQVPPGGVGPIIPVIVGDPQRTIEAARQIEAAGCLVAAIRPPTVPRDTARLRISLSAAHSPMDVDALGRALVAALST